MAQWRYPIHADLDSSKIHILAGDIAVNPGVTLTIASGAIIKTASQVEFFVQAGGILSANGTSDHPIIFTTLTDDSVGGDSNYDGESSKPTPGFWFGVTSQNGGQVNIKTLLMCVLFFNVIQE